VRDGFWRAPAAVRLALSIIKRSTFASIGDIEVVVDIDGDWSDGNVVAAEIECLGVPAHVSNVPIDALLGPVAVIIPESVDGALPVYSDAGIAPPTGTKVVVNLFIAVLVLE
jgi:hypothetical protein